MKKNTLLFALVSSAMIIAFFFIVNRLTSPAHPWFVYPAFVTVWWPLSVWAAKNRGKYILPIGGSLLIAVFFGWLNWVTSPNFFWSMFPIFAVAWWPMAQILFSKNKPMFFAVLGSAWTILLFVVLNLTTTPHVLWSFFPVFAVLWWPFSLYFSRTKQWKLYAIIGAVAITLFFALINWKASPHTLWFVYPAYAVAWWPLSMFLANKSTIKLFSVLMSGLTVVLLAIVNIVYTPQTPWVLWAAFYFIWWPLCQLLGAKAKTLGFAIMGAVAIIGYHVLMYNVLTPDVHPWYLYLVLPALWWPITVAFKDKAHSIGFLLISAVAFALYYGGLNWLYSPNTFWSIYLLFPLAWMVIGGYFGQRKQYFALSIWGTIITILFFSAVNYMTSPRHIWAVYPAFVIVFWPLSLYFFRIRNRKTA